MSECAGRGCTHPEHLRPPQYGTSLHYHYPHCIDGSCTGCVPPLSDRWGASDGDTPTPVIKYDGEGQPVRASQLGDLGLNRAERRAAARQARRRR